ncbi:RCC1 and BTB domain-containing protein 2-like [Oppia nitens]|uniref:RCC1 and BTB domain-containing protein 2-like n=1 Tax=Oppia nitens TaxID=1686743 RepID=UPI0023DB6747|nr:RCC1 and BTB domain-containing protein 2-like [Oppia nitens]
MFVTNDDRVYGLGYNGNGRLGLGHNILINEPKLIDELCGKQVNKFIFGNTFGLCLTSDQQVYSWGSNEFKQLGRTTSASSSSSSSNDEKYCKPAIIEFFTDKFISDIQCGKDYSLALNSDGTTVYGWGDNSRGQCGCGQQSKCIETPTRVIFPDNNTNQNIVIKSIYCHTLCSFALTRDGFVYSWGYNQSNRFGYTYEFSFISGLFSSKQYLTEPQLVSDLSNIKSIANYWTNKHFTNVIYFLTNTGQLYETGVIKKIVSTSDRLILINVDTIILLI